MATLEELLEQSNKLAQENIKLQEMQKALAEQTLALNNAIEEEKKKKELEQICIITIEKVEHDQVWISTNGKSRSDVLEILKATPTRQYQYLIQQNIINIQYWSDFKNRIDILPNIEWLYKEKNKEFLENYFSEKLWQVSKDEKQIKVKLAGRNKKYYLLTDKVPSASHSTVYKGTIVLPFSEGWRLIQVLPVESEDVSYTPDVLELIEKQVAQRKKMDEVALANDAEIPKVFVKDYDLKPYQRAGVFFLANALGINIPEVKKVEVPVTVPETKKVSDW